MIREVSPLNALRARADLLGEVGRWREAIPLLQSALGLEPDNAGLHCRMAQAQLKVGDTAQAMKAAERAIVLNPSDDWGYRLQCVILLKGRDKRRILRAAEEAAALNPHSIMTLSVLTQALLKAGKIDRAREMAEQMRRIAPQSPQAHEALALVAIRQRRWLQAEIHCRTILKINPQSYAAFHNLGLTLRCTNRMTEAIESFLEAQRLNPVDPLVRSSLDKTVRAYLFDANFLQPLLISSVICVFFGFLPLGVRSTYGPLWAHVGLFGLAALLAGIAGAYLWRRFSRLKSLSPTVRQRLSSRTKRDYDI